MTGMRSRTIRRGWAIALVIIPVATSIQIFAQGNKRNATPASLAAQSVAAGADSKQVPDVEDSNDKKKSYVIPALEVVAFEFALNRFSRRYVDRESFDVTWSSIRKNLHSPWVVDKDDFETNQFLHPYQGSVYHSAARS